MKKLIALLTLITISLSTFSQTKDLCARGGLNLAKHREIGRASCRERVFMMV